MTHPIHPILVHFPIALLFASVLFDLVFFVSGRKDFKKGGFWLLILGAIGGLAAALTGVWAEEAAERGGVPESAIERHEFIAMTTLVLFAVLMLIRGWARNRWSRRDRWIYLGAAAVALSFLTATGFLGGDLVYRYGAGVQSRTSPSAFLQSGEKAEPEIRALSQPPLKREERETEAEGG